MADRGVVIGGGRGGCLGEAGSERSGRVRGLPAGGNSRPAGSSPAASAVLCCPRADHRLTWPAGELGTGITPGPGGPHPRTSETWAVRHTQRLHPQTSARTALLTEPERQPGTALPLPFLLPGAPNPTLLEGSEVGSLFSNSPPHMSISIPSNSATACTLLVAGSSLLMGAASPWFGRDSDCRNDPHPWS